MLDPKYLASLPDPVVKLFTDAEQEIIADMARRIRNAEAWISSVDYQNQKLLEAGVLQEDILTALSGLTARSNAELRKLMQEAGSLALRADSAVYEAAGLAVPSFRDSKPLTDILNAGYKATAAEMRNLCRVTANTAARQFERVLDTAWMKVNSGAFDLESSIRSAIKELAEKGVEAIKYKASGRTDTIEVAVRRAVQTGVNQTAGKLQEELADELDCDLVEVTAHEGARPSHAAWHGRIYSRSGNHPKYPDFRASTGFGKVDGLCGVNCRHSFGPYIEGSPPVWSEEKLAELEKPKYEYNGKMLTEYEASQVQRKNEREIRRWKRVEAAMKADGLDTSEASAKIAAWNRRQEDFLRQTGFKRQYERENVFVANFGNRGILNTGSGSMYIESIDKPIEQRHTGKGNPNAILHFDVELNRRQKALLEKLTGFDSRVIVRKNDVSMTDLSALTAATGDEFALFTKGGERLIIRGNSARVNVDTAQASELVTSGYKWSGHTHPGIEPNCLIASQGDVAILRCFNQERSSIYNSTGSHAEFWRE